MIEILRFHSDRIKDLQIHPHAFQNSSLSLKAQALYAHITTKPVNWEFSLSYLINCSTDGEESVRSGMKELRDLGYLHFFRTRDVKTGIFSKAVYLMFETPVSIEYASQFLDPNSEDSTGDNSDKDPYPNPVHPIGKTGVDIINKQCSSDDSFEKTKESSHTTKHSENSECKVTLPVKRRKKEDQDIQGGIVYPDRGDGRNDGAQKYTECNSDLAEMQEKNNGNLKKPLTDIPENVKPFLAVWESAGFKLSKNGTNRFHDGIINLKKLLNGSLFNNTEFTPKKYTLNDFIVAVERMKVSLSPDYYPLNKQYLLKMNIYDFLYNPYAKTKSLFLIMLESEPKLVKKQKQDFNPDITELIIKKFQKEILGGINYVPSELDREKFIKASSELCNFFSINSKKFPDLFRNISKQVEVLWLSIETDTRNMRTSLNDITPGFFCSETTFSRRLPAFLNAQGFIKKEGSKGNFSIYR